MIRKPSPNFNERQSPIDMIIVHYTDMPSAEDALSHMCNPEAKVSAHYLIDEWGEVYQLVDDAKRAWHAGESYWAGESDINSRSIGIELDNPGHSGGLVPFTEEQMQSLEALILSLQAIYHIPGERILGHSDVAPHRKVDPGPHFPWAYFYETYGWGLPILEAATPEELMKFGYNPLWINDAPKAYGLGRG